MTSIPVSTRRREEMVDLSDRVREAVRAAGVVEGTCLVYAPHTTCAVTVNEGWDPAVVSDALGRFRGLVPRDEGYAHAEGNSDAHIKAMLVGTSAVLAVSGGELQLGRWQSVFLCEFDGPRQRHVWIAVTGGGPAG